MALRPPGLRPRQAAGFSDADLDRPTVLAVVVTHDGRRWLGECLGSLERQTYPLLDVVVVDDSSPVEPGEPPLDRLAARKLGRRRHEMLRTPRQFGFGGAVNWALDRLRPDAELLLFVHDDVALDPDSVEHMVRRMSLDPATAIVGPKVVAWDEPSLLEEVGWSTDRFGHGYHGLEEGERDSGQRDLPREVFHVTSTCMLVRSPVFHRLQGWDTKMRAFCEDMDLCWRARLAGHRVEVDPAARVRHAAALSRRFRRITWGPPRYLLRRNRFRAVAKNSSGLRLLWLVPVLVLFALAEVVAYLVVRQPRAALQVLRALGWNLAALPSILPARWRAQRARKVSDGSLRRFIVPATIRMRSYAARRSDRLEAVLGRRARALLSGAQAPMGTGSTALPVSFLFGLLFLVGARGTLLGPPVAAGELLPFPEGATAMFHAFARRGGFAGAGGPAPPALVLLGVFPVLTFGAAALAQKLLVVCLGLGAGLGTYRVALAWLGQGRAGKLGAWAAAIAYVAGPLGYAGMRSGRLGALVFAAAAPWVAGSISRLCGLQAPVRRGPGRLPPVGREMAGLAVGAGLSAAFVPGSLLLYTGLALLAMVGGILLRERDMDAGRGVGPAAAFGGIAAGWCLLLPWSASWWNPGGPLFGLLESPGSRVHAAAFAGESALSVLLARLPQGSSLMGPALLLAGVAALASSPGPRRRAALFLWACLGGGGLVVALWASGSAPPLVASPLEAGVPAALAWALLTGLAVAGALERLGRTGPRAIVAAALVSLLAALGTASLIPALASGGYAPVTTDGPARGAVDTIESSLGPRPAPGGGTRILWVGQEPTPEAASGLLGPPGELRVTGPEGPLLSDLFPAGGVAPAVTRSVASVEAGGTDRVGRLLAPWDIGFIIVWTGDESGVGTGDWLSQRDLALVSEEPAYLLFANAAASPARS